MPTVAIIGSFRQHYDDVLAAWQIFAKYGIEVTSPKGTAILQNDISFVRFESDAPTLEDPDVQSLALHRIFRADTIYVVAPDGYVGRTTCYEIGRAIQARRPIYFSAQPKDLPLRIPQNRILTAKKLSEKILSPDWEPTMLFGEKGEAYNGLEKELLDGRLRQN